MVRRFAWFLVIAVLLTGCEDKRPPVPTKYQFGQQVYFNFCAGCHEARQESMPNLWTKKYLRQYFSDERIKKVVLEGGKTMPSMAGQLHEKDMVELIKYIRFYQKEWAQETRNQE